MIAHALQLPPDEVADTLVALHKISPCENGRHELFVDPPSDVFSKFYNPYCVRVQSVDNADNVDTLDNVNSAKRATFLPAAHPWQEVLRRWWPVDIVQAVHTLDIAILFIVIVIDKG